MSDPISTHPRFMTRFCVLGIALLAWSCGPGFRPAGEAPPVVLISVDTLRADHLPAYGYEGVETPAIDRLAEDSILFEHAYAHAPSTLPSHASILTGVLPPRHGARDNAGFTLDPEVPALAGLLSEAGYRTGAFVSAFPMRAESGIDAGFGTYDAELDPESRQGLATVQRDGNETLGRALAWLDEPAAENGDPPFLFLHIFEPHTPYAPPPDLAERYPSAYDGEIAQADRIVGRLLDGLRERELYEPALIVFLSDHGEGLGEHGEETHGIFVYTATLRVPLLVKLPGGERGSTRVTRPAQLVDVMPTILEVVGRDLPDESPGTSLLRLSEEDGKRSIYSESYAPRLHFGWSELVSLIEYPHHYIEAPVPEIYDLEQDPGETVNRFPELPGVARRLGARLRTMTVPVSAAPTLDPATRDRLAALGYLGAGSTEDASLADPKSKIHILGELQDAAEAYFAGDFEEAVGRYEAILAEEPTLDADAWRLLGQAQMRLGRLEEAASSFETLLAMGVVHPETHLQLAELYLALGRPSEAAEVASRARSERPAEAALLLARGELAMNRIEAARPLLQEAVTEDPESAPAHALLAETLMALRADPEEALRHAEQALSIAGDDPQGSGLRVLKGRILLTLGRGGEASESFVEETRLFPGNLQAYRLLARMHLDAGNSDTATGILQEMVSRNPGPEAELAAIATLRAGGYPRMAEEWRRRAANRYPGEPALTGEAR